jgi:hypothetical protein
MELNTLEDSLNDIDPGIVKGYIDAYQKRAGDQFRPDPIKFYCMYLSHHNSGA